MNITEASKQWKVSRATIYNKINTGELSRTSDGNIDPAEMSRIFGQPKKRKDTIDTNNTVSKIQPFTLEKMLIEQQLEFEKQLRTEVEKRMAEYKERAERAEARETAILQQMKNLTETLKLIEAPKNNTENKEIPREKKKGFFHKFF